MKSKPILILASATLVAVAYAVYDFQSEKSQELKKAERSRIVGFEPAQVNQIEILSRDVSESSSKTGNPLLSNKIKLVRGQDGWKLEEPIQEIADQKEVQDFVDGLVTEKADEVLLEGEQVDWKVFGLDEPKGQIVVQNNLGESKTIFVSSKKNYQGDAFLKRDQEQRVLLASSTWFSKVEKRPMDFRDKRLLRKPLAQAKELGFQSGDDRFTLKYEDLKWSSPDKPTFKLDQNKVRDFLAILSNPVLTDVVKESNPTPDEAKKWGLSKPRSKISVKFADDSTWTATLGRDADKNNYVQLSEPSFVVKIPAADAEKLATLKLDTLRDRKEPFEFKKQDVKKIEIRSAAGATELELKGSDWEPVKKAKADLKVESEKVNGFLVKLGGLEVAEFIDKKMPLPGKSPKTVALKDESGKVIFELKLGEQQKKKVNGQDRSLIVTQSNLFPETVTLDEGSVKALGIDEFLGDAEKNKTGAGRE
jgi:hypothetical protein